MKRKEFYILGLFIAIVSLTMISCEDDSDSNTVILPSIKFITEGYVHSDTTIAVGDSVVVKIEAQVENGRKLVNFIAVRNGFTYLDEGLNELIYEKEVSFLKGSEETENWEFIIRDKNSQQASLSLTISLDPASTYGEITRIEGVKLGAQQNTSIGSFYSIGKNQVYTLDEAYADQASINMVYYYDDFIKDSKETMASPGTNIQDEIFPGDHAVSTWTHKDTLKYTREKLSITTSDFDKAENDSLLIATTFAFEEGGKKAKQVQVGDMFAFIVDNKAAIFKVNEVVAGYDGYVDFDIIIQK